MASVQVSAKVIVEPRLEVLTITLKEFLKAFGADSSCLEVVDKGIYKRQLIEYIVLKYYCNGGYRGRVKLSINWDKYRVEVMKEDGKEMHFTEGTSILEQLDKASKLIIRHVNKMRADMKIDKIKYVYGYVKEACSTEEELNKTRTYFGHVPCTDEDPEASPEFKTHLRYVIDALSELEITVDN